jgi:hypothetical protein
MAAEAKLILSAEGASNVQDVLKALKDAARDVNAALKDTGSVSIDSSGKIQGLKKWFDDIVPSTKTAEGAFKDLHGTLSEMWENPTAGAKQFAGALGSELAGNLGTIGIAAGGAAAAIGVLGAASFELAEHAASVGGALNDMSEKTGISVPALSNLSGAVQIAGGSLDQVSGAIFKFQQNLGEGSDKFVAGLERLHVSLNDIKNQSPDQQFLTIASAIKGIEDPSQRAAAAVELFGKQGKDLLPLLNKPLDELIQKSRDLGLTWTTEDAAAAEEFEMETNALRLQMRQFTMAIGRDLIPQMTEAIKVLESTGVAFHAVGEGISSVVGMATGFNAAIQDAAIEAGSLQQQILGFVDSTVKAQGAVAGFKKPIDDYVNSIHNGLPTQAEMASNLREIEEQTRKVIAAQKDAAREQERQRQLWEDYNSVGRNVIDTIDQLDGRVVEAIKYDLQRGESIGTLTKIYGVHTEQIKAIEQEEKFLASITDSVTKSQLGLGQIIPDLTDRTRQFNFALQGLTKDGLIPMAAGFDDLARAQKAEDVFTQEQEKSMEALQDELAHVIGLMPDLSAVARETMRDLAGATHTWADGLESASRALSDVAGVNLGPLLKSIQQLVDGTGDIWKVVGAGAGVVADATDDPATKGGQYTHDISKGAQIGTAIMPGWGTLVGMGVGAAVAAFSVSPEEKAARSSLEDFDKQFGSMDDMIKAVSASYALLGKSGTEAMHDLQEAFDASHESAQAEATALARINGVMAQSTQRVADVKAGIAALGPAFSSIVAGAGKSKASFDDLGQQAVTDFTAMVAGGMTVSDAMASISPALSTISQGYTDLGIDVDNVAVKNLLMQNTVISGNPELIKAIGGLASEMEALDKLGVMNVDTLESMERTGLDTYATLQGKVAAMGGSTKDALVPMQSFLHDAAAEAFNLGIPLDDNTQMLIDQSKELGIWRDAGKDATAALNDSTLELNNTMQTLRDSLGSLTDAFSGIPSKIDVTVVRHYVDSPDPPPPTSHDIQGASTGGIFTASGIEHFRDGGIAGIGAWGSPSGGDTIRAWVSPGEMTLTQSQQNAVGALMARGGGASDSALHAEVKGLRADLQRVMADNKMLHDRMNATIAQLPSMLVRVGQRLK